MLDTTRRNSTLLALDGAVTTPALAEQGNMENTLSAL